jgi:hypothetical protein
MGSTRKCFRGQRMRARDRDQRLLAGANCRLAARVCTGTLSVEDTMHCGALSTLAPGRL